MRKIFKKAMIILTIMLCLTTAIPNRADKEADAFGGMTLAGIAAATGGGAALLPYALGAAGILAVGGVIKNWDVVKDYGEKVIAKLGGYDAAAGSVSYDVDGAATVIYSPAMKAAMAQSVDNVPATIYKTADPFSVSFGSRTWAANSWQSSSLSILGQTVAAGTYYVYVSTSDISLIGNPAFFADNGSPAYIKNVIEPWTSVGGNVYRKAFSFASTYYGNALKNITIGKEGTTANYYKAITIDNISFVSQAYLDTGGETLYTADTFGTVADNVNARLLGMNAAIADNQAVTFSADAELLDASIDDLASISNAQLSEAQTQTGILSQIWRSITSIPSAISSAGVAASTAINNYAQNLWDDAGAIWSGLADTTTGIKADINAKMSALQDAMAGGIDNVKIGINDMRLQLGAGIDSVAANVAAWGQLTLDGIESGVGALSDGLTNIWTGVTSIPATIATGVTDITDKLTSVFVMTPEQVAENSSSFTATKELLLGKFDWITTPIEELKSIYSQRKSLHDVTFSFWGQEVHVLPYEYAGVVSVFRGVLSGSAIISTIIYIYKRVQPNDLLA